MYKKLMLASLICFFSYPAFSLIKWDTSEGSISLYGDVEFNMDAASKYAKIHSLDGKKNERWEINGRILLGFDGLRKGQAGDYAGFSVQPLASLDGDMNLDDAVFYFGNENLLWQAKVGRFEAYNMFPLGEDTFIEYSGDTGDSQYDDGSGYIYMMKEGRGRSSSGGNFLLNKEMGLWYFELNTIVADGSKIFVDNKYHDYQLTKNKNTVYTRPVAALKLENISIALGLETNLVKNAYGYNDPITNKFHKQSRRDGYGMTMSWFGDKNNPNKIDANISVAYLDATGESDFSAGGNILWNELTLGYIFANNDISGYNPKNSPVKNHDIKYKINTFYTSYRIHNIMNMDNFNVHLGAYYSRLGRDSALSAESGLHGDKNRYGFRLRFKYYF